MDKELQALEAILFASTKPLKEKELKTLLQPHFPTLDIKECLADLDALHQQQKRPIRIGKIAGGYLLETIPTVADYIAPLFETKKVKLSKGSLEVLSIIAYKQPITKPEIDTIRGIDSTSHLDTLLEGEWIESQGKKEVAGRPTLYGTSEKFLLHFNLNSVQDLLAKA